MLFQMKIFEKFPRVQYSSQITETMRQSILAHF
nr:MAG TPA: hypothetical protein [Caudoviricetes sp.]